MLPAEVSCPPAAAEARDNLGNQSIDVDVLIVSKNIGRLGC